MPPTRRGLLKAGAMLLAMPGFAEAQDPFPNKPLRYVVPVSAGGGSDLIGRTVADRWGRVLGQSIVVENQAGGGGVIACQMTAKATPDGYSLMQGYVATHGTNPATRKVPYDPLKDFTAIGMIGGTPNVLVVGAGVPASTLAEFIAYAKKSGAVAYGSSGPGSLTHLSMELFAQQVKVPMTHAAYRGIAPAFNDLIGGQTQAMFPGLSAALPHIRSGRVQAAGRDRPRPPPACSRTCRRWRKPGSRASTPSSGTAWSARPACLPISSPGSTARSTPCSRARTWLTSCRPRRSSPRR